jgi:hypothetical protein
VPQIGRDDDWHIRDALRGEGTEPMMPVENIANSARAQRNRNGASLKGASLADIAGLAPTPPLFGDLTISDGHLRRT